MLDTSNSAAATVDRWRAAAESSDVDAALACLSPDIVLTSPLTDQFRLEGTDQVRDFLAAAFTAVKGINFPHPDRSGQHLRPGLPGTGRLPAVRGGAAADAQ